MKIAATLIVSALIGSLFFGASVAAKPQPKAETVTLSKLQAAETAALK